ncbi:MAG TPA: GNAT family N-acetyltransferase [Ilumatobacter sp.]|nr:GNAT family N-acetyltransferase [Ilumatobacter sp.]
MIDPLVRPATADDAAELALLEGEAREALADHRGGARWLADHPAGAWADEGAIVYVAHIDDVIVGYIVATVDGAFARVVDVYVTAGARELGFGDELLATVTATARAAGATTLDGEALPGDRSIKNLYERAGIKARLIVVSTPL